MILRRILILTVAASLTSCVVPPGSAFNASHQRIPVVKHKAKPGNPLALIVGVKQFTSASSSASPVGVRDYENLAASAMLIKALNSTPGVSQAYFVPTGSPGVDLVVDGIITNSNGRDLTISLSVSRIDGKILATQQVAVRHAATDLNGIRAADEKLFSQAAGIIAATRQKFAYDPDDLRALVYADSKLSSTPEIVRMGAEAAKVERSQIFTPLTSALTPRIAATSNVYYQWQKESVPFMNERDLAAAQMASAEADEALGMILSFAGGVVGGYGASQGNALGMLGGLQGATSGAEISAQGTANAAVAQNKINELSAQLAKINSQFSFGAAREMTVRIYNKVLTLKGSKEEMTAEFRKVVKEEMGKELAKTQADALANAQKATPSKKVGPAS